MANKENKTTSREALPKEGAARFKALVGKRLPAAKDALTRVGKIARSKPVEYDMSDVVAVNAYLLSALNAAVKELEAGLKTGEKVEPETFDFDAIKASVDTGD